MSTNKRPSIPNIWLGLIYIVPKAFANDLSSALHVSKQTMSIAGDVIAATFLYVCILQLYRVGMYASDTTAAPREPWRKVGLTVAPLLLFVPGCIYMLLNTRALPDENAAQALQELASIVASLVAVGVGLAATAYTHACAYKDLARFVGDRSPVMSWIFAVLVVLTIGDAATGGSKWIPSWAVIFYLLNLRSQPLRQAVALPPADTAIQTAPEPVPSPAQRNEVQDESAGPVISTAPLRERTTEQQDLTANIMAATDAVTAFSASATEPEIPMPTEPKLTLQSRIGQSFEWGAYLIFAVSLAIGFTSGAINILSHVTYPFIGFGFLFFGSIVFLVAPVMCALLWGLKLGLALAIPNYLGLLIANMLAAIGWLLRRDSKKENNPKWLLP